MVRCGEVCGEVWWVVRCGGCCVAVPCCMGGVVVRAQSLLCTKGNVFVDKSVKNVSKL